MISLHYFLVSTLGRAILTAFLFIYFAWKPRDANHIKHYH
jgi:hypothetical protein